MSNKSFTLIELLVVIVIIALLSGFVAIQVNNSINAGKDAKRKADIKILANAVISYSSENYSNKPVSLVSCTINGDCPSEINSALSPFLENLPSDPDSGQYYTYESDGTDCNISAILSTGQTYRYSCSSDSASIVSPINGTCGTSSGLAFYTQPSTELCSDDSTPSVSGTGPWTWNCSGQYQGVSASCFANKKEDGVCGASDGASYYNSSEISSPCSAGTASSVSVESSYAWTCDGIYGGTSSSCSANIKTDGVCGSSDGTTVSSVPTTNLCSSGTSSSVANNTTTYTWSCSGAYGGIVDSCVANIARVDGVCGSANGGVFSSAPSDNLCSSGTVGGLAGQTYDWYWYCYGNGGGVTSNCSAERGLCGNSHTFRQCGSGMTWDSSNACYFCKVTNVCYLIEYTGWCYGSESNRAIEETCGQYSSLCLTNLADNPSGIPGLWPWCPSGWSRYGNWSTTESQQCSGATSCTTGSHYFSNTATESCSYLNSSWVSKTCYSFVTETGCQ